jgi:hypothetical protein
VTQKGAAYVVFGRAASPGATFDLATLNGTNGFAIAGSAKFELAGVSVSGGDVNADGFSDVIVGTHSGKAYIVFGKAAPFASSLAVAALNGTNGFTIDGVAFKGGAGSAISAAGAKSRVGRGFCIIMVALRSPLAEPDWRVGVPTDEGSALADLLPQLQ